MYQRILILLLVLAGLGCSAHRKLDQGSALELPRPADVDPLVWDKLTAALETAISRYHTASTAGAPPQTPKSKVSDLQVALSAGSPTFTWSYRNAGDYSQDGEVNVSDLSPLGLHFGKTSAAPDWAAARIADGDENLEVNIADVTPIGANLGAVMTGYLLQASNSPAGDGNWVTAGHVPISAATKPEAGGALQFSITLPDISAGDYFRVAPYFGDPDVNPATGIPSDPVSAAALPAPVPTATKGTYTDRVVVSWIAVPNVTSYRVFRDGSATMLGSTATLSYEDTTLTDYLPHEYRVKAVYSIGVSDFSAPATGYRAGRGKWWTFGKDQTRNRRIDIAGPASNEIRWARRDEWFSYQGSSPAVGLGGTIYIGDTAETAIMWFSADGDYISKRDTTLPTRSSPCVGADGKVYYGSDNFNVYAINPDGTQSWNFLTGAAVASSPVIDDDGNVYVTSHDYQLYSLSPTGTENWRVSQLDDSESSPLLTSDERVVVGSESGYLRGFNTANGFSLFDTQIGDIKGSPALLPDAGFAITNRAGFVASLDSAGAVRWSEDTGDGELSSPAIATDGAIVFGSADGNIYCYNPDGTQRWAYPLNGPVSASPAIDGQGNIFGADESGYVICISSEGNLVWDFQADGKFSSSPAFDDAGHLLLASENGWLYCFGPRLNAPPKLLSNLVASDGTSEDSIILTWDKVYNATGYNVYKDGSGTPISTLGAGETGWIDTPVLDLNHHTYKVKPFNEFGDGPYDQDDGWISGIPPGPGEWNMVGQDAAGSRRSSTNGPRTSVLNFSFPADAGWGGYGGPAIGSAGELYFTVTHKGFSEGKLVSLTSDGAFRWEFPASGAPCAYPAVGDDGTIYFGTDDGMMYAVSNAGGEVWSEPCPYGVGPITFENGRLYFCTSQDTQTICMDATDGSIEWVYVKGNPGTAPAIGSDGSVYVCDQGGNKVWITDPFGNEKPYYLGGSQPIDGSPSILRDNINGDRIYFTSDDSLFCWLGDGTLIYRFQVVGEQTDSTCALAPNGAAYVGIGGSLYLVSPVGSEVWSKPGYANGLSRVCVDNSGYAYANNGTEVFCVKPSGDLQWELDLGVDTRYAWPALGPVGTYFVQVEDGTLHAFGLGS